MWVFLKSLAFTIAFWIYTVTFCLLAVFAYALPRKGAMAVIKACLHGIWYVEKIFLGLDYRVSGRENLPPDGHYILALKHQSAYETMKLLDIFGDCAVILKRELALTPLWGWYTLKLGMIPVDRGGRNKAVASLLKGARRVQAQNRPILIFPQGTRVNIDETPEQKPYKIGIARMAETLNLPVVPVALNSGVFWPKKSFIKHGGVVDFKILPPIPAGLNARQLLAKLEEVLEPESNTLVQEALARHGKPYMRKTPGWIKLIIWTGILLFGLWAAWWHIAAYAVEQRLKNVTEVFASPNTPDVNGFPGALHITWPDVTYKTDISETHFSILDAKIWPLPGSAAQISAPQGMNIVAQHNGNSIRIDTQNVIINASFPRLWLPKEQWAVELTGIDILSNGTSLTATGRIAFPLEAMPVNGTLDISVDNYQALLQKLVENGILDENKARMAGAFFDAMVATQGAAAQATATLSFPLTIRDDVVYAGFLRLVDLKDLRGPAGRSASPLQKIRSGDSVTDGLPVPDAQMPLPVPQP